LHNLFRLGANVFYDEVLDVHVSGHASQEEQKMMINLLRPKYFVPIHGDIPSSCAAQ
jgi:ribonuclease J